MKKLSEKLIIASAAVQGRECLATVLYDGQRAVEFSICAEQENRILGNIYVAKVEKIQKNINGAFVLFQPDRRGYLSLDEFEHAVMKTRKKTGELKPGDELLVQVDKEAIKQKLPRLTTNLTLSGKYLVMSTGRKSLNFSRKLSADERSCLKKLFPPAGEEDFGMIIRTNARETSEEEILREYETLKGQMERICRYGTSRNCFSCLFQAPGDWIIELKQRSFHTLSQIITDHPGVHQEIEEYLRETDRKGRVALKLYQDPLLPLRNLYSLDSLMNELKQQKVWLKSGGFLVIQQTEAFVAIDVNTGKYGGKKTSDETFHLINLEAAGEIALQLRLRQLSGIILIDFINMNNPAFQKELMDYLQELVSRDSVKTQVIDITPLHIVELTRRKEKKSFQEQLQSIMGKENRADDL